MGTPVTLTYFPVGTAVATWSNAAKFGTCIENAAPTNATTVYGWRMGTAITASSYCQKVAAAEAANTIAAGWRARITESAPIPLRGDGWIMGPFDGIFDAGNWQATMSLRSVGNAGTQLGRLVYKVWIAPNPAVSQSYTSVTNTWQSSSITPALSTLNLQARVTASITVPQMRLFNSYIIVQEVFNLTNAGSNTNADADWSYGSSNGTIIGSGVSASFTTTPFTPSSPPFMIWNHDELPEI